MCPLYNDDGAYADDARSPYPAQVHRLADEGRRQRDPSGTEVATAWHDGRDRHFWS
jgi:hypothetical protein